jgi:hypothetical protein
MAGEHDSHIVEVHLDASSARPKPKSTSRHKPQLAHDHLHAVASDAPQHREHLHRHDHWCGHTAAAALRQQQQEKAAPGSVDALRKHALQNAHSEDAAKSGPSLTGSRGLRAGGLRPLKIHWEFQLKETVTAAEESYLRDTLMPAAAAVLARVVQVRFVAAFQLLQL